MEGKDVKCPLSGYDAKKYSIFVTGNASISVHLQCYVYVVNTVYGEIRYGVSPILDSYIGDENTLQRETSTIRVKEKLWSLIVENFLRDDKTSIILCAREKDDYYSIEDFYKKYGSFPYETKVVYEKLASSRTIIYKEFLKSYPSYSELVNRILGNFINLGKLQKTNFGFVKIGKSVSGATRNYWEIFFTPSLTEVEILISSLIKDDLLQIGKKNSSALLPETRITLKGIQMYSGNITSDSKMCFVAMKFGKGDDNRDMIEFCNTIIKPAVAEAGYYAEIVSDTPSDQKICDKVIADIRKAKFIIVDLTHGNQGAYYEAGFAQALNKTVIYICEKKWFQDGNYKVKDGEDIYTIQTNGKPLGVHFDIDHYNIIQYDTRDYDKLKEELIAHINARVIR